MEEQPKGIPLFDYLKQQAQSNHTNNIEQFSQEMGDALQLSADLYKSNQPAEGKAALNQYHALEEQRIRERNLYVECISKFIPALIGDFQKYGLSEPMVMVPENGMAQLPEISPEEIDETDAFDEVGNESAEPVIPETEENNDVFFQEEPPSSFEDNSSSPYRYDVKTESYYDLTLPAVEEPTEIEPQTAQETEEPIFVPSPPETNTITEEEQPVTLDLLISTEYEQEAVHHETFEQAESAIAEDTEAADTKTAEHEITYDEFTFILSQMITDESLVKADRLLLLKETETFSKEEQDLLYESVINPKLREQMTADISKKLKAFQLLSDEQKAAYIHSLDNTTQIAFAYGLSKEVEKNGEYQLPEITPETVVEQNVTLEPVQNEPATESEVLGETNSSSDKKNRFKAESYTAGNIEFKGIQAVITEIISTSPGFISPEEIIEKINTKYRTDMSKAYLMSTISYIKNSLVSARSNKFLETERKSKSVKYKISNKLPFS